MIVFDGLWQVMKERQITTYALREKWGMDSRTIRRLKANQNVTTQTLSQLCEILDCSLEEIARYVPKSS